MTPACLSALLAPQVPPPPGSRCCHCHTRPAHRPSYLPLPSVSPGAKVSVPAVCQSPRVPVSSWRRWRPRPRVPVFPELPPHRPPCAVACLSAVCPPLQRSGCLPWSCPGELSGPTVWVFQTPSLLPAPWNRPGTPAVPRARETAFRDAPARCPSCSPPRELALWRRIGHPRGHGCQCGPSDLAPSSLAAGTT